MTAKAPKPPKWSYKLRVGDHVMYRDPIGCVMQIKRIDGGYAMCHAVTRQDVLVPSGWLHLSILRPV